MKREPKRMLNAGIDIALPLNLSLIAQLDMASGAVNEWLEGSSHDCMLMDHKLTSTARLLRYIKTEKVNK